MPIRSAVSLVAVAVVLSGCSVFHHKDNYYSQAVESRPLEVPPDLDAPAPTKELNVPAAGTAPDASAASPSGVIPAVPAASSGTIGAVPATSDELQVADSPGSTWERIGAALEQSNVGKISERDQGWKTYTVMVALSSEPVAGPAPAPAAPEEHHWYSRVLHPFGGSSNSTASAPPSGGKAEVKIKVKADAVGSRVTVRASSSDAQSTAAAQRVIVALRDAMTQQASAK